MIDFAGLVGKITGKGPTPGPGASPEPGVATGGEFAALVQLAAQAGLENGQAKLRLVVDNGTLPDAAALAVTVELADKGLEIAPVVADDASSGDDDDQKLSSEQEQPKGQVAVSTPGVIAAPTPIVATWTAVPVATPARLGPDVPVAVPVTAVPVPAERAAATPVMASTALDATEPDRDGAERDDAALSAGQSVDAKPNILAAALRAFVPRSRVTTSAEKVDAANPIISSAATATSDETEQTSAVSPNSSPSPFVRTGEPAASVATTPSPLRAIVDALPPVVQSELGVPSVRVVAGPSTGEALGDQVIDMGVSGQWIDRMAREISALADGSGHSRFTLNPPHLGKLQVDLWNDGGATSIHLLTETDEAAQRLTEGRPALQADARIAALSFGTITVEKAGAPFDAPARDQGSQRQAGDLSGQAQQQQAEGQAQARAGNARGSDWISRSARDDDIQTEDASARTPDRASNGRVRFA